MIKSAVIRRGSGRFHYFDQEVKPESAESLEVRVTKRKAEDMEDEEKGNMAFKVNSSAAEESAEPTQETS